MRIRYSSVQKNLRMSRIMYEKLLMCLEVILLVLHSSLSYSEYVGHVASGNELSSSGLRINRKVSLVMNEIP